jgi:hypothetical protein
VLAFTHDRVFGVTGKRGGAQWELFARRLEGVAGEQKDTSLRSVTVPAGTDQPLLPAGPALFVAGPGNEADPAGGMLSSYSAADGSKLSELRFGDAPVFDGMAAANGRLYLSTQSGKILCLGAR